MKKLSFFILIIAFIFGLAACQTKSWQIEVYTNGSPSGGFTQEEVGLYLDKIFDDASVVDLGQILYVQGFSLIDEITFSSEGSESATFGWDEIASSAAISETGEITIAGTSYFPQSIDVSPSPLETEITLSILDIAPTIAYAMGWPELTDSIGEVRISESGIWDQAVMIFIDGLQYENLLSLIQEDALPGFQRFGIPQMALTVYPPITTSATASLLTGTPPKTTGVFGYGYRKTDQTTLFDLVTGAGLTVTAIEGSGVAFNLGPANTILSGDSDGDGFTDDNVFANTMEVIQSDLPDLLFAHFHDVDDMGHNYGPQTPEYESAIVRVDGYISQIYDALPENTFLVIFADHGMHTTDTGGAHGTLTAADMIIPILFTEK